MLKVNVSLLMSALRETEPFVMTEMNAGTKYLFDSVYRRMANGEDVCLSELDLNGFELDDVSALRRIYDNEIAKNNWCANQVIHSINRMEPVCAAVSFA